MWSKKKFHEVVKLLLDRLQAKPHTQQLEASEDCGEENNREHGKPPDRLLIGLAKVEPPGGWVEYQSHVLDGETPELVTNWSPRYFRSRSITAVSVVSC